MSKAWKAAELAVAKKLGGRRILRGSDFSESAADIDLPDLPHWRLDVKYRAKHAHHTFLREVREKYCAKGDVPVLITKARGEHGAVVSMSLDDFAALLAAFRGARDELGLPGLTDRVEWVR